MTDYKNTLNLPKTTFPMRGNLVIREPIILKRWYEQNLYDLVRRAKKGKKIFILHDGPPYANGSIHIGHSINKILKDIIIKYKGLMGYNSPFIPGWDCHGLPIELKVEQILGKPSEKISSTEFRVACRQYAAEQVENQKKDFIRMGILGDWKNPYLTMDFTTEANTVRSLSNIITNGYLQRGVKPVHWCINCHSALAEAEVEYYDRISPSIYVSFTAVDTNAIATKFKISNVSSSIALIIWSTTPWTLPANRAIAIHPNFDYQLIKISKHQSYIIAAELVKNVMTRIGVLHWTILSSIKGKNLEQLSFHHAFMLFNVPTVLSNHVTLEIGTGAVHIAPGYGPDDYTIGQKYDLEIINLVGSDGLMLSGILPELNGLQVFKANEVIIKLLRHNGSLLHIEKIKHSYPHCWRHKTPTIFRTTLQWFININRHELRKKALKIIKDVHWIPSFCKERIQTMIDIHPNWCISRQRIWGVPIALFIHNDTGALHPNSIELLEIIAQRIEQEGIQFWWDVNPIDLLGKDAMQYHKVQDTLDVWFDSGSTHFSVIETRPEFEGCKSDLYLEGSDQHRGWFMSSLILSIIMRNQAPYCQVLTHGFTVDSQGRKMSKSAGNVISPQTVIDTLGADILRIWVASTDYTSDMAISNDILKHSVDVYRRVRNTARFLLTNLSDFDPILHSIRPEQMVVLDRWAVERAQIAQTTIKNSYENYDFHNVIKQIMQFCSVEMSAFYLDVIKDRQYTTKSDCVPRRSCQTALYHIIEALVRWITPIMSFTADEIWNYIPGKRTQFVFTEEWYDGLFGLDVSLPLNDAYWQIILQIRNEINKIVEQARIDKRIRSSLEANVTLYAEPTLASQLCIIEDELHFALLTSSSAILDYAEASNDAIQCEGVQGLKVILKKAIGKKCSRCWHYETDVGEHAHYPEICSRCIKNVVGLGEERKYI
ncbi:isoleucine--tRNA ligase [Candidatus Curculioniphilus buchneri]|uniref:isoleucine--tRNA ligase n=1 Tax=Candidatus Curculioniphilus buchneri TaxID=690594 RepID=UPI00376F35E1